jgi:hypothetical protein
MPSGCSIFWADVQCRQHAGSLGSPGQRCERCQTARDDRAAHQRQPVLHRGGTAIVDRKRAFVGGARRLSADGAGRNAGCAGHRDGLGGCGGDIRPRTGPGSGPAEPATATSSAGFLLPKIPHPDRNFKPRRHVMARNDQTLYETMSKRRRGFQLRNACQRRTQNRPWRQGNDRKARSE